jgi:hypothetical protein
MTRSGRRRNPWDCLQQDEDHHQHSRRYEFNRAITSNRSINHKAHNHHRNNSFATGRPNLPLSESQILNPLYPQNSSWKALVRNSSKYNHTNFRPHTQPQTCGHSCKWKTQELKRYLIQTFEQALAQIEQYYGPVEDEMDWQPEQVIEIRTCCCSVNGSSTPSLLPKSVMSCSPLNSNCVAAENVSWESSKGRVDGSLHRENTAGYIYASGCRLSGIENTLRTLRTNTNPTPLHNPPDSERGSCPLDAEIR